MWFAVVRWAETFVDWTFRRVGGLTITCVGVAGQTEIGLGDQKGARMSRLAF